MKKKTIEICCCSIDDAIRASQGGADREDHHKMIDQAQVEAAVRIAQ